MQTASPIDLLTANLDRARTAFSSALETCDATAAAAAYAHDATLVAPAADAIHGRAAIERFWRTGVEAGVQRMELTVLAIQRRGRIAMEVGRYALYVLPETGPAIVDRGRYLVLHRADGSGRWTRWAEMFSPEAPRASSAGQGVMR